MRGKSARFGSSIALLAALFLVVSAPASATVTIGADLRGAAADFGVCALAGAAGAERTCTDAQYPGGPQTLWETDLVAPFDGTIVSWSVVSGTPSPGTLAAGLRLRTIDSTRGAGGANGPFLPLPLDRPGEHVFPAHMHVEAHQRIGLDSVVTASGAGPAVVPIARLRPGAGHVQEWAPPLAEGLEGTELGLAEGSELLLSAEIEPERVPPRTKLTYANRQDFMRTREVVVWIRSNESATAIASGQLEWPNGSGKHAGRVVYGLTGVKRQLEAGRKAPLRLRLPRLTYEAALGALADGQRILVKATVDATDAAGNRSGVTVATIRPKR